MSRVEASFGLLHVHRVPLSGTCTQANRVPMLMLIPFSYTSAGCGGGWGRRAVGFRPE
jgi:hypothetical protein